MRAENVTRDRRRQLWMCCGVVAALLAIVLLDVAQAAELPHVSECNYCFKCHTAPAGAQATTGAQAAMRALRTARRHKAASQPAIARTGAAPGSMGNGRGGRHPAGSSAAAQRGVPFVSPAGRMPGGVGNRQRRAHQWSSVVEGPGDRNVSLQPAFQRMFPTQPDIQAKQSKPNCTECIGCSTQLRPLKGMSAFGKAFPVEPGASPEWIFIADAPPEHGGIQAVVKVWCMPIDKVKKTFGWRCRSTDNAARANQFLVAQDRVLDDCGLRNTTVKTWVAPVNAIEPESGLHIWWDGLWMERASGVSMNQISYITKKQFVEETTMKLLNERLHGDDVVRSAMLDLLTSQCDRHSQNVFIDESGALKLIDNLQAMKHGWLRCGSDSIFLPGTPKNEVVRFGGNIVSKVKGAKPRRGINPMLLLDYRCFADGGKIATNYPPQLTQCLKELSSSSPDAIMSRYGFPVKREAEALFQRAKDMLEKGFEWTLQRGEPVNPEPLRFRWHAPCCKLALNDKHQMICGHEWNVTAELPFGNTARGGPWMGPGKDPGTFTGGTVFE